MNYKFKILFLYPNEPFLNPPPVSIGILAAILRKSGFDVAVFDDTFYQTRSVTSDGAKVENLQVKPFNFKERGILPDKGDIFEDLRKKVSTFKPDLIALSALEGTYQMGVRMLEAIKDYKIPVVAGGVYPTVVPEEVSLNPLIKFVCVGEGEIAMLKLCEALAGGKDYTKIKNIWVKDGVRKVIKNDLDEVVDLNTIPTPDFSVFDPRRLYRPMAGKVYRLIPIETNRGCPFQCAFCNAPTLANIYKKNRIKNYFRKKSIKKIYQDLKFLVRRWNAEYIYFSSDTFLTMSDDEFCEFVEMYSEFSLPFWIQTRPETVRQEKMDKLKIIGCHRMSTGLEHGNSEFRKNVLKKGFKNKTFIDAAKMISRAGIPLTVNNIIGFPFETRKLVFDTIELNRKIMHDSCNCYSFYPFKGTALYEISKNEGFIRKDLSGRGCLTVGSSLDMPQFSNEEIRGLMRTFVLYVKMPKMFWKEIKRAEKFDEAGNREFERLKGIYLEKYS